MAHEPAKFCNESLSDANNMWRLISLLLLVKVILIFFDPNIRLFMGDSASYLHSAVTGWRPPDRSITYPLLIRFLVLPAESAVSLVVLQSVMGIGVCLLVYRMLIHYGGLRRKWATLASLVVAIEPAQLFYERMVMAESFGTLSLVVLTTLSLAYISRGKLYLAVLIGFFGVLSVSLRMSLLPVILGLGVVIPLLRLRFVARQPHFKGWSNVRPWFEVFSFCVILTMFHLGYQAAYGARMDSSPTYLVAEGQMRLGLIAPLIEPKHFEAVGLSGDFAEDVALDISYHRNREGQMWAPDGLWAKFEEEFGYSEAQLIALSLSSEVLRSNPTGLIKLSLKTIPDYFRSDIAMWRLYDDMGRRPPDAGTIETLRAMFRYDANEINENFGIIASFFRSSRWWLTAILLTLAPLALLTIVISFKSAEFPEAVLLIALTSLGLVFSHFLFAHIISFRYLHPMPIYWILCIGCVASRWAGNLPTSNQNSK